MTTSTPSPANSTHLQSLADRLAAWRSIRIRGERIPQHLWDAATELARVHGLSATAVALKLSYYDLQRRLSARREQRKPRAQPSTSAFIELAPPVVLTAAPATDDGERGTLEWVQPSGARLTLRLPKASAQDLLPVVQLFLQHRP
jgi:hypothetical protein